MSRTLIVVAVTVGLGLSAPCFAQTNYAACPTPAASEAMPWKNAAYSPDCRTEFVIEHLATTEAKLEFLSNRFAGMAKLGLQAGGVADGPAGIRGVKGVTAFPTPLTLGASFDPSMAFKYGDLLGQELEAAGITTLFGPATDVPRTWHFGRVTESYGEDPYLSGRMVAEEITSLQAHPVVATIKHFAAYTQEQGRAGEQPIGKRPGVDEIISERALREIYFPAFKAAVQKGHAGGVMCSFPRINGIYACENSFTLGVLKNEWAFTGFVVPDFPDAQRSIVPAIKAGLDLGATEPGKDMFGEPAFSGQKSLKEALDSGEIGLQRVDDMIRRLLLPDFQFGVFDHTVRHPSGDISTEDRRRESAAIVAAGAVLLKNEARMLPLTKARSIAVIGTQAGSDAITTEQGSPYVPPVHLISVKDALTARAGKDVRVTYAPGTLGFLPLPSIPEANLTTANGAPGVAVEYSADPSCSTNGTPLFTEIARRIEMHAAPEIESLPGNLQWCVRYRATFKAETEGVQHFSLTGSGEGRLLADGVLKAQFLRADMEDTATTSINMKKGQSVLLEVRYSPRTAFVPKEVDGIGIGVPAGLHLSLGWSGPNKLMEDAVTAAKAADVAVVVVGHRVGEGMDRLHLALPGDQDELIRAVASANPHTVVVLNTGGAVTMPWLQQVAAVVETWLPGDASGPATASLLYGDSEPGGRLPITFPRDESQGPGAKTAEYPGTLGTNDSLETAHFDEGIFVGYRYFDQHKQDPLFPFGYGLSYTTFRTKVLRLKPTDGGASVTVEIVNTGDRPGSDVIQIYLNFPAVSGEPPKQLKQFTKVTLSPGESKNLTLTLSPEDFLYWDTNRNDWIKASAPYEVLVGRSSRDITWRGTVTP